MQQISVVSPLGSNFQFFILRRVVCVYWTAHLQNMIIYEEKVEKETRVAIHCIRHLGRYTRIYCKSDDCTRIVNMIMFIVLLIFNGTRNKKNCCVCTKA